VLYIYDVELAQQTDIPFFHQDPFYTPEEGVRISPKAANEWVTLEDIEAGWTPMSRPISRT